LDFSEINRKIAELENQLSELRREKHRLIWQEECDFRDRTSFTVRPEHLKLLKAMVVEWDDCEFGAPRIDCKRPYGNSDVYSDIAEIIGLKKKGNWDYKEECWNDNAMRKMDKLHNETFFALQILLQDLGIEEGKYKREDILWKKVIEPSSKKERVVK